MKFILHFLIVIMLVMNVIPSFPQENDSTSVLLIYTNPIKMKIKIKGDEYKSKLEKNENELIVEDIPAGMYKCRFINSQRNLKASFMVPPNDTLAIMANIDYSSQDPITFASMDELREARVKLKEIKEIRDSINWSSKKIYLEKVLQNVSETNQKVYEPTDEEIQAKTKNQDSVSSVDNDMIFYIVEQMPEFNRKDPTVEFRKYIAENITFSEDSCIYEVKKKITVISQFIVGSNGYIRDIKIITQNVPECIEENVVDFLYSSPRWMPGFQHGKPVNVFFTFPITFIPSHIEKDKRIERK